MTGDSPTPAELADQAAELVRALNHATLPGAGRLTYPGDAYSLLANLAVLVVRLPQALTQTETFLARELAAGRVVIVHGEHAGDPQAALTDAAAWLHAAHATAHQLHHDLDHAAAALVWAAGLDPNDP